MTERNPQAPQASIVCDGDDLFIEVDGVRIARRGHPGTLQAGTWVSLEPGWQVLDGKPPSGNGTAIIVTRNDVTVH